MNTVNNKLKELAEKRDCARWCWHEQSMSGALRQLFEAAVRELEEEDQRLFRAFGRAGKWKDEQCQGLAYWVFEHNLVFPIFRAWLPLVHRVTWDECIHRRKDGRQRESSLDVEVSGGTGRKERGRELIDLVVEPSEGAPPWLFEAKWWAYGKAESVLGEDANRLRPPVAGDGQGYLLTFWYGADGELARDLERAAADATELRLEMLFVGVFPTHVYTWWDKHDKKEGTGYFALVVFGVGP